MKHCLVTLTALLVASAAYAQGTVNFVNKITGSYDAKVFYAASPAPLPAGAGYVAQLFAGPVGGPLVKTGDPVPFRTTAAGLGYWSAISREVAGVPAGSDAQVQAVSWLLSLGTEFAAVKAGGNGVTGGWGESNISTVKLGGGTVVPGEMSGLTGYTISAVIPEPSIAALGLLGAGLLLIRRKK